MAAKNHVEFHVSEQGWGVCQKKLRNLCWAACCWSPWKMSFSQAVVRKAVSLLKMSLSGLLGTTDANNNPCTSSVYVLGGPKRREMGGTSF